MTDRKFEITEKAGKKLKVRRAEKWGHTCRCGSESTCF